MEPTQDFLGTIKSRNVRSREVTERILDEYPEFEDLFEAATPAKGELNLTISSNIRSAINVKNIEFFGGSIQLKCTKKRSIFKILFNRFNWIDCQYISIASEGCGFVYIVQKPSASNRKHFVLLTRDLDHNLVSTSAAFSFKSAVYMACQTLKMLDTLNQSGGYKKLVLKEHTQARDSYSIVGAEYTDPIFFDIQTDY